MSLGKSGPPPCQGGVRGGIASYSKHITLCFDVVSKGRIQSGCLIC